MALFSLLHKHTNYIMLLSCSFHLNSLEISAFKSPSDLTCQTQQGDEMLSWPISFLLLLPYLLLFLFQTLSLTIMCTCAQGATKRVWAAVDRELRYTTKKSHRNMAFSNVKEN